MHAGEVEISKRLQVPYDWVDKRYNPFMPPQHQLFFSNLPYFIFGNLDSQGRPWVSIISGNPGFVNATSENTLAFKIDINKWDPVLRNLQNSKEKQANDNSAVLFSGLGIDFSNRRRNKVAGIIQPTTIKLQGRDNEEQDGAEESRVKLRFLTTTQQSLGNCPKYINIRAVKYAKREHPQLVHDQFNLPTDFDGLPKECVDTILQCDTIFIATRHLANEKDKFPISDMDVNHRGGPTGFVRVIPGGKQIVWPDYSGNQLYQSLGNIESDHLIGMAFANFTNGDILYVTGQAENLFGDDASNLLPSSSLITRVTITGYVFLKGGLDIVQVNDKVEMSPYNPPVRYLTSESSSLALPAPLSSSTPLTLSSIVPITPNIYTFTFTFSPSDTSSPFTFLPGQHLLVDFSKVIPKRYSHMNDARPQRLNDDFIRSWTISSSPFSSSVTPSSSPDSSPTYSVSCTIKLKESGEVTPLLYYYANMPPTERPPIQLFHRGINGSFSVFSPPSSPSLPLALENENMLFIAGGIGVTPFLSFYSSLLSLPHLKPNITLLFSCRDDEIKLALPFFTPSKSPIISSIQLFQTGAKETSLSFPDIHRRRMEKGDLEREREREIEKKTVYICGPDGFMKDVTQWLIEVGVKPDNIKQEQFNF